jgi:hypothetical protein
MVADRLEESGWGEEKWMARLVEFPENISRKVLSCSGQGGRSLEIRWENKAHSLFVCLACSASPPECSS